MWDILIKDIPKEVTSHTFNMDILKQGVSYDFRVIGVNDYGYGSPSLPSPSISGELSQVFVDRGKKNGIALIFRLNEIP